MISALSWIPRGSAATVPSRVKIDARTLEEEMKGLSMTRQSKVPSTDNDNDTADSYVAVDEEEKRIMDEFHMDDYDEETEETIDNPLPAGVSARATLAFANGEEDPNLIPREKDPLNSLRKLRKEHQKKNKSNIHNNNSNSNSKSKSNNSSSSSSSQNTNDNDNAQKQKKKRRYNEHHDIPDDDDDDDDSDDDSDDASLTSEEDDIDDYVIRPSDIMFVAARNDQDEVSSLEVFVYEPSEANMYVHHDVMMPTFPLSLAWTNSAIQGSEGTNHVAVGSFLPGIEIWNLDVVDAFEPVAILGGSHAQRGTFGEDSSKSANGSTNSSKSKSKNDKKSKNKKNRPEDEFVAGSHTDAVLGLAWNTSHRQLLASGSADHTVKLWDLTSLSNVATLKHHTNKVQSVNWHLQEPTVLLSASFDKTAVVADMRNPEKAAARVQIGSDAEQASFSPWQGGESHFFVSNDKGSILCFDVRNEAKPLFRIDAHDGRPCTCMSMHPSAPGLMVTAGLDEMVKIWSIDSASGPSLMTSRNLGVGKVFVASQCFDDPFLIAVGGSTGSINLWNLLDTRVVANKFGLNTVDSVKVSYSAIDGDEDDDSA
eukprot:ANDGO_05086.mRNA.1 putative WD repeat-containing protein C17D11.16